MVHIKHVIAFVSAAGCVGTVGGCSVAGAGSGGEDLGRTAEAISTDVCPPNVPAELTPPAGETLKAKLMGVGVQIYMCTGNVNVTPIAFTWTPVGPNANLFNDDGKLVGTHFIGPTWQGTDGSSVVAAKKVGVSVDPSAVPWLRLAAVSHGVESGRFDDVTSIQRLSTVGGNAPADGCDAAHVGSIAQVPYTADYVFYHAKEHGSVKQCGG